MHQLIIIFLGILKVIVTLMFAFIIFDFFLTKKGGKDMQIQKFADEVTMDEGKKKPINKGQVLEVLKIANKKLDGKLYAAIREKGEKSVQTAKEGND